ncbi:hypothetical protein SBOR_6008 [Sclerotinia borealis F-4128]|uniref:Uncharacterized protein n=1 Tax=Sclerotinia borealis (strain F-4128) TaxID=1432307 RepID=W9CFN3_SCLBF|nr:hypothetical protein SBOR_6008 [Sclerotinia borealis F-4128]
MIKAAQRLLQDSGEDLSKPILLRTPNLHARASGSAITSFVVESLQRIGLKLEVNTEPNRPEYARQVGLEKAIGDMALFNSSPHSTIRVLDE